MAKHNKITRLALTAIVSLGLVMPSPTASADTPLTQSGKARQPDPTIPAKVTSTPLCWPVTVICRNYVQFGFVGVTLAEGLAQIPKLSDAVNHTPTLVGWYQDFSEPLNVNAMKSYVSAGQTPIITWEPQKVGDKIPDNYPLRDIANGKFDRYLTRSATALKSVRGKVILRFAHEMNGYWYPWGQPKPNDPRSYATRTNTPADYVAAYQHIHEVLRNKGVRNVYWMWSPNLIDATPSISLASLYPGDSYVDVVGLSGYLHGIDQSYTTKYVPTITQLNKVAPTKPIIVAEGAVDQNANRKMLVSDLLDQISHTPRVQGFLWLNKKNVAYNYTVDKDPDTLTVIRRALRKPPFVRTAGPLQAIAQNPTISGTPLLGNTLSAQASFRGKPRNYRYSWFLCDTQTEALSQCRNVGSGAYHLLTLPELHKYLRVRFTTVSPNGYDSAISAPSAPVLNIPDQPDMPAVNLRGTSTQLVFSTPNPGATNLVLRIDGGNPIYLPVSTREYWINGLTLGSQHGFTASYVDILGVTKSEGESITGTFTAMSSSNTPSVTVASKAVTITLPPTTSGQTGWEYQVDGGAYLSATLQETNVLIDLMSEGTHTVGIRRVSEDGRTLTRTTSFDVQPAPVITAVNLRGTSTQLTFDEAPAGVTHLVVRLDEQPASYIPIASAREYWVTNLVKGQTYHISVRYKYSIDGFDGEGWYRELDFVALSTPPGPDFRIDSRTVTIYLPDVAIGQTGWKYSLDNGSPTAVSIGIDYFEIRNLTLGAHRFALRAIGDSGETLEYPVTFTIVDS